jgi:hypothetical protein
MFSLLGIMTVAGGLFLFLWYRTVAGLPVRQQPQFSRPAVFKWGVPAVSLAVFATGMYLLAEVSRGQAAIAAGAAALVMFLVIRFDRYSANMRLIHDHYSEVRRANPEMEEIEALFLTAAWRYPKWSHDRLVELVAGKSIEELVLLMILNEYEINPISDWELYRTLKAKAAGIVRPGR